MFEATKTAMGAAQELLQATIHSPSGWAKAGLTTVTLRGDRRSALELLRDQRNLTALLPIVPGLSEIDPRAVERVSFQSTCLSLSPSA